MTEPKTSTEEIIRELQQGRNRKRNFSLLYSRYSGPIRRFFEKNGVTECEELKDDVFFAVYNNLEGLRDESKFEYWLFTIARNIYRNWLKQEGTKKGIEVSPRRERGDVEVIDPPAPPSANPELKMLEEEKLRNVWTVLQELPAQKRLVAILAWVEGRSPKEISSILPIKINTVYAHLHQAQKILKRKLRGTFDDL